MDDGNLPFHLTLVTNENAESTALVSRRKTAFSTQTTIESLGLAWPRGVFSLSHVALPFPPDDPVYGRRDPSADDRPGDLIHLGQIALQGERGMLRFSSDWLLRLRHNPLYPLLETRVLEWVEEAGRDGD